MLYIDIDIDIDIYMFVIQTASQQDQVLHSSLHYLHNLETLDSSNHLSVLAAVSLYQCVAGHVREETAASAMKDREKDTMETFREVLWKVGKMEEEGKQVLYLTELKQTLHKLLDVEEKQHKI